MALKVKAQEKLQLASIATAILTPLGATSCMGK